MAVKTNITGYHVEVMPKTYRLSNMEHELRDQKNICEDMVKEIKRHVDDVDDIYVITEFDLICEHCGSVWTESKYASHNGGCCDKDAEIYLADRMGE